MATSGTTTFNLDFDDIIEEAYERCGLESRTGYDMRTARRSLNLMFLEWANRGLNLWTIEQRSLALVAGTAQYDLPEDTVNILSAVVRTGSGSTQQDITLDRISQNEYLHTPDKLTQSRPSQYFLQRTSTPVLFIYPAADTSDSYTFQYYAVRRIQDVGDFTNTADAVFRFLPALVAGLAYHLALKKSPDRITVLKQLYEEEFLRAAMEDRDTASVYLTPEISVGG
jgi:hypothetical protein